MVYLDLSETDVVSKYNGINFYFSSEFNRKRFENNVDDYIKVETLKMINRYKVKANWSLLLMVAYYKKIEKRGFRIEFESGEKINPDTIIFAKLLS